LNLPRFTGFPFRANVFKKISFIWRKKHTKFLEILKNYSLGAFQFVYQLEWIIFGSYLFILLGFYLEIVTDAKISKIHHIPLTTSAAKRVENVYARFQLIVLNYIINNDFSVLYAS